MSQSKEKILQVANERRHMGEVKDALGDVLLQSQHSGELPKEFVEACIDYLEFVMVRFNHHERQSLIFLMRHVRSNDPKDGEALRFLETSLKESEEKIESFAETARQCLAGGPSGRHHLIQAGLAYVGFHNTTLAGRKGPLIGLVKKYASMKDFRPQGEASPAAAKQEQKLYERVCGTAPEGLGLGG